MGFSPSGAVIAGFSRECLSSSQTNFACWTGQYTTRVRANNASESPNALEEDMFRRLATTRVHGKPGVGYRSRSSGHELRVVERNQVGEPGSPTSTTSLNKTHSTCGGVSVRRNNHACQSSFRGGP